MNVNAIHIASRRLVFSGNTQYSLLRWIRSKLTVPSPKKIESLAPKEWEQIKGNIPGEKRQRDQLIDRIPKFPLAKESVPKLLPRPDVPRVGPKISFRHVIEILKNKKNPELIYEGEAHRLYFLACFCCALVFTAYGLVLLEYANFRSNQEYEQNAQGLNDKERKREWVISHLKYGSFGVSMLGLAYFLVKFPSKLVRRMWYLPGREEHIKFTSYPIIPGTATPVYTIPLKNLSRKYKGRVWTGKGFYGASDKNMFFFVLKESSPNRTWVVDRSGFFWSDGRVFDYLFGKETIAQAEAGVPYDEQIGQVTRQIQKKKQQLKEKHGMFYTWKLASSDLKSDIKKIGNSK